LGPLAHRVEYRASKKSNTEMCIAVPLGTKANKRDVVFGRDFTRNREEWWNAMGVLFSVKVRD
jgi:hypothetical protein